MSYHGDGARTEAHFGMPEARHCRHGVDRERTAFTVCRRPRHCVT